MIPLSDDECIPPQALMKEGGGGDNLAIAWQYPGQAQEVIPASYSLMTKPAQATPQVS